MANTNTGEDFFGRSMQWNAARAAEEQLRTQQRQQNLLAQQVCAKLSMLPIEKRTASAQAMLAETNAQLQKVQLSYKKEDKSLARQIYTRQKEARKLQERIDEVMSYPESGRDPVQLIGGYASAVARVNRVNAEVTDLEKLRYALFPQYEKMALEIKQLKTAVDNAGELLELDIRGKEARIALTEAQAATLGGKGDELTPAELAMRNAELEGKKVMRGLISEHGIGHLKVAEGFKNLREGLITTGRTPEQANAFISTIKAEYKVPEAEAGKAPVKIVATSYAGASPGARRAIEKQTLDFLDAVRANMGWEYLKYGVSGWLSSGWIPEDIKKMKPAFDNVKIIYAKNKKQIIDFLERYTEKEEIDTDKVKLPKRLRGITDKEDARYLLQLLRGK